MRSTQAVHRIVVDVPVALEVATADVSRIRFYVIVAEASAAAATRILNCTHVIFFCR